MVIYANRIHMTIVDLEVNDAGVAVCKVDDMNFIYTGRLVVQCKSHHNAQARIP